MKSGNVNLTVAQLLCGLSPCYLYYNAKSPRDPCNSNSIVLLNWNTFLKKIFLRDLLQLYIHMNEIGCIQAKQSHLKETGNPATIGFSHFSFPQVVHLHFSFKQGQAGNPFVRMLM
jgi:hypothetical protein